MKYNNNYNKQKEITYPNTVYFMSANLEPAENDLFVE